ncbi:MAG: hypothetical protein EU532_00330 [Promethearchaeota archaeon]|nr:MAG: hypothetical protein EU532_00330 [Candidatus Lokiarchaeota archaeon]
MSHSKEESDLEKAWEYYEKIKSALDGLFEILSLNFDENDIFYQCGVDNLERLKETIMDLLQHDYNPAEIKRKLRDLEFDMKKCLFFEKPEKEEEDSKAK